MTTQSDVFRRVSKLIVCDGCGRNDWQDGDVIYEVTVRTIGTSMRTYMHFCHRCTPPAVMERHEVEISIDNSL